MNFLVALMAKEKKIYHRNDLRQSLSALNLPPRRILWLVLAQQEKDEHGVIVFYPNKRYVIREKDYAELCGIDESNAYRQLKDGMLFFTVANHGYYSDGYIEIQLDPIMELLLVSYGMISPVNFC